MPEEAVKQKLSPPSLNGVIKITRRSMGKFQFGDAEPVVELDVIEVSDQWYEIDWALRVLDGDEWVVPPNKVNEHSVNRLNFVQAIVNDAYAKQHPTAAVPTLTRAEAEEFIHAVREEAAKLRNFIFGSRGGNSSSGASTEEVPPEGETNFSQ